MKTETRTADLLKFLQIEEATKAASRADAVLAVTVEKIRDGLQKPPLIDPCVLSAVQSAHFQRKQAKEVFQKLLPARRAAAEQTYKAAIENARRAVELGAGYSGTTSRTFRFGKEATAYTVTDTGEQYSRSCKYRKTNAEHVVQLDPARVHILVDSPRLRELSSRDGLELIALDADGRATWVVSKRNQIAAEHGWVIGDDLCCFHSTKSREDAAKGHARKRAELDRQAAEQAERERLRRASPEYKAERRARLVARLCSNLNATVADAKAAGYCTPGIEQFQRQHGIGDTASLPDLCRTKNPLAVSLALRVARQSLKNAA